MGWLFRKGNRLVELRGFSEFGIMLRIFLNDFVADVAAP